MFCFAFLLSIHSLSQKSIIGKWKPFFDFEKGTRILSKDDSILFKYVAMASLELKKDHSFIMINNGIIVKNSPTGWHYGATIKGKWKKNDDKLILIADNKGRFTIQYEIKRLEETFLELKEIFYGTEISSNQLVFNRE